jgi:hypothetical protein
MSWAVLGSRLLDTHKTWLATKRLPSQRWAPHNCCSCLFFASLRLCVRFSLSGALCLCVRFRCPVKTQETPTEQDAAVAVRSRLGLEPIEVRRLLTGLCHFVFAVETSAGPKAVVRIATPATRHLLQGGVYWNDWLRPIGIPLPAMLAVGLQPSEIRFPFVILEHLPGVDLHAIYQDLSSDDKFQIVSEIARIQKKVSALPEAGGFGFATSYNVPPRYSTWGAVLAAILGEADQRMNLPDHPGRTYLHETSRILEQHKAYFAAVKPVPFLDDTTTKNVLISQGRLSGIVDVDQVCFGDLLLPIGLTQMALLAGQCDLDYTEHWMSILRLTEPQRAVVNTYTALFCVVFMSELGQCFNRSETPDFDLEKFSQLESTFKGLMN